MIPPPKSTEQKPIRAWPEQASGGWTIEKARAALSNLELGYLTEAARLTRALSRDARYTQGREQFIGAVLGCPADIVPAPRSQGIVPAARRLAEECPAMLWPVLGDAAERWLIEWGRVMNLAIGYLTWDTTARPWRPVSLTRWPLDSVRVDLYKRQLYACTTEREIEIVPGDGTWVVYTPAGWLNFTGALVQCLGESFVGRRYGARDLVNRTQASSVAAIDAEAPEGAKDEEIAAYQAKLEALQTGSQAGIVRRAGWPKPNVLDLSADNTTTLFDQDLKLHTADMLNVWLGQDGTANAGGSGGSYAKLRVLDGVLASMVAATAGSLYGEIRADLSHAPGCITSQIVRPWVLYQGEDPAATPLVLRRVPDAEEDERLKAEHERAGAWRAEVEELRKLGYLIGQSQAEELARARGVRMPALVMGEPPEPEPMPAEPTAPPPSPEDAQDDSA